MKKFLFASLFAMLSFCAMAQKGPTLIATLIPGGGTPNFAYTFSLGNLNVGNAPGGFAHWYHWSVDYNGGCLGSDGNQSFGCGKNLNKVTVTRLCYDCDPYDYTITVRHWIYGNSPCLVQPPSTPPTPNNTWVFTGSVQGKVASNNVNSDFVLKDQYLSTFSEQFIYQNLGTSTVKMTLIDTNGKVIAVQNLEGGQSFEENIGQVAGVYLLQLERDGKTSIKKIIKTN